MVRRGIIIYGLPPEYKIGKILSFANQLLMVKQHVVVKRKGQTELHITFDQEGMDLYGIARKIHYRFGLNAQVKYITVPDKKTPKGRDPRDFGNPHIKETSRQSNIQQSQSLPAKTEIAINSLENNHPAKLRIDLDLKDIDSLLEYLKSRTINSHQRERYQSPTPSSRRNDNSSNRSTFIAQNVLLDKRNVEVYINGKPSRDIRCWVEEKSDAYILHLYYRDAGASKTISIAKSMSQEPLRRIRYNEKNGFIAVNGKNVAITFEGYEGYRRERQKADSATNKESSPSIIYEGKPVRQRRTALVKQSTVVEKDSQINVIISDDESFNAEQEKNTALPNLISSLKNRHINQDEQELNNEVRVEKEIDIIQEPEDNNAPSSNPVRSEVTPGTINEDNNFIEESEDSDESIVTSETQISLKPHDSNQDTPVPMDRCVQNEPDIDKDNPDEITVSSSEDVDIIQEQQEIDNTQVKQDIKRTPDAAKDELIKKTRQRNKKPALIQRIKRQMVKFAHLIKRVFLK